MIKRLGIGVIFSLFCFVHSLSSAVVPGTPVVTLTPDGAQLVPIVQLRVGCKVLSMSADGSLCWAKVTKTSSFKTDAPHGIILRHEGPPHSSEQQYTFNDYNLVTLHDHDRILEVSPRQSFYDPMQRRWVQAQQLKIGTKLLASNFEQVLPVAITHRVVKQSPVDVCAIEVEHPHVYFIGDSSDTSPEPERLILTHNGIPLCAAMATAAVAPAAAGGVALAALIGTSIYAGYVVGNHLKQHFSHPFADQRLSVVLSKPERPLPNAVCNQAVAKPVVAPVSNSQQASQAAIVSPALPATISAEQVTAIKQVLSQTTESPHQAFQLCVNPWLQSPYKEKKKSNYSLYVIIATFLHNAFSFFSSDEDSARYVERLDAQPSQELVSCAQCGIWQLSENAKVLGDPAAQALFIQQFKPDDGGADDDQGISIDPDTTWRDANGSSAGDLGLGICEGCGEMGQPGDQDPNNKNKKDKRCKNCRLRPCQRKLCERDRVEIETIDQNKMNHLWGEPQHKFCLISKSAKELSVQLRLAVEKLLKAEKIPEVGPTEKYVVIRKYFVGIRLFVDRVTDQKDRTVHYIIKWGTAFVKNQECKCGES